MSILQSRKRISPDARAGGGLVAMRELGIMRCRWTQSSDVLVQHARLHSYGRFQIRSERTDAPCESCRSLRRDRTNHGGGGHQKEKRMAFCGSFKKAYTEHFDEELDACFKQQRGLLLVAVVWRMTRLDCLRWCVPGSAGDFKFCRSHVSPNARSRTRR